MGPGWACGGWSCGGRRGGSGGPDDVVNAPFASSSLARSFWLWILRSVQTLTADVSPKPGMWMMGMTSKGKTHSSRTPNFSRIAGFSLRSWSAR